MRAWWTLVRRELAGFFLSWTGYIVIALVVFLLGLTFAIMLQMLTETDKPITEEFYNSYTLWLILLLASPLITMRTFAHEKYSGTFETLMTTPVSDKQVVFAKFSGAMIFYLLMWSPLLACIVVVRHYSHDPTALDPGTLGSTFLGLALLGSLYLSLGCFASSLTRSQIIAAMISMALGISLFLLSFLSLAMTGQAGWIARIFTHLSLLEHMRDFSRGVVDVRPLVFYLSLTGLFLFLTLKSVESRRWK